jgi:hypothetical protein
MTNNQIAITNDIPPPPFKYSQFVYENKGKYSGSFFGGLLPIEIEEYIFWLAWNMGITDFHRLLLTMVHNPINTEYVYMNTSAMTYEQEIMIDELKSIQDKKRNITRPYKYSNWPNTKSNGNLPINLNKKIKAYYSDRLEKNNIYGNTCMGHIHTWNDGDITITTRRVCEDTGISQYKHNSRKNNFRYDIYGPNYNGFINDTEHRGYFRNTSSKFLLDYNMNTPIKKIKEYLKENEIVGYSKVKESNKADWINTIYKHTDA